MQNFTVAMAEGFNECNGLWVLKKSVIRMYSWQRLSLPLSFSSHFS